MADFFFENTWPCCVIMLQDHVQKLTNEQASQLDDLQGLIEGKFREVFVGIADLGEFKQLKSKIEILADLTKLMLAKSFYIDSSPATTGRKNKGGKHSKEEKKLKKSLLQLQLSIDIDEMLDQSAHKKDTEMEQSPAADNHMSITNQLEKDLSQLYLEKPTEDQIIRENKFLKFFISQIVIPFGSRIPETIKFLCQELEIDDMNKILLFINKKKSGSGEQAAVVSKKRKRTKIGEVREMHKVGAQTKGARLKIQEDFQNGKSNIDTLSLNVALKSEVIGPKQTNFDMKFIGDTRLN